MINGLQADVVTLALEYDVDAIEDAGLIDDGWVEELPEDSCSLYLDYCISGDEKEIPKNIQGLGRSGTEMTSV